MKTGLQPTYHNLRDLTEKMKAVGLPGLTAVQVSLPGVYGASNRTDRVTTNISGTKIIVPPPFNYVLEREDDWYNDEQPFGININGEGVDEPSELWFDINPQLNQWIEIGDVIFNRITIRNNSVIDGQNHPVRIWVMQDPQFINQINTFLDVC